MLRVTNHEGEVIVSFTPKEPNPGSVVLTHGKTGTAWQRFFNDGMWHSVTGKTAMWPDLLRQPNLFFLYETQKEG